MLTFADLRTWDDTKMESASQDLRADLKVLEKAQDELETEAIPKSWIGLSRWFAEVRRTVLVAQINAFVSDLKTFERAVYSAAPEVKAVTTLVDDIDADAKEQEFQIGGDGSVRDIKAPPMFENQAQADGYTRSRTSLAEALADRIEGALDDATEIDSALHQSRPDNPWEQVPKGDNDGTVDPVVEREWSQMSNAERERVLRNIAEENGDKAGVEDFTVRFEDLEDEDGDGVDDDPTTDSGGYWSEDDRQLVLDVNDLDDPALINTVAHEVRHIEQDKAVDDLPNWWDEVFGNDDYTPPPGATREDVEAWRENSKPGNYKSTENGDTFEEYEGQPVEVDAREAGGKYLDEYDPEDLERHRK